MELAFDCSREYGIVLEGGGAKGSYQIGAWKALREAGVQIKGIAGASVGALNGALMCMDDLEKAEYIWSNIAYSKVMNVDDSLMERLMEGSLKELPLKEIAGNVIRILRDGGFDISPLKRLIEESIEEERIRTSKREFYITTFSVDERKEEVMDVRALPDGQMGDALLASAYFMAFKNEKLGGKRYMDGGGFNNVPLDILIDKGYQDILVIRIYGMGFDTEKVLRVPEDVKVSHIAPRQSLGGMLEFDSKRAKRNILLGYYDAMRFLYHLEGQTYYFDAPESETSFFHRLMDRADLMIQKWEPDMEAVLTRKGCRGIAEQLLPALAKKYRLKDGWNYKELYLTMLEHQAKKLRVNRFAIYTPGELEEILCKRGKT